VGGTYRLEGDLKIIEAVIYESHRFRGIVVYVLDTATMISGILTN